MRLKQLRNLDEFKILNPYRNHRSHALPDGLLKQLKKITHLSSTTIDLLTLPPSPQHQTHSELNLIKMAQAHEEQELRFHSIFEATQLDCPQLDLEDCSHS